MLRYVIVDPTGNTTALVESAIEVEQQSHVAARIMERHPDVEQVGFVHYESVRADDLASHVSLRMAGGEFCGNATMSAAFLYATRHGLMHQSSDHSIMVRASGVSAVVHTRLTPVNAYEARTSILMPQALAINEVPLPLGQRSANIPVVYMPGISHAVIRADSPAFKLLNDVEAAEKAARAWCKTLNACGLGLMFLQQNDSANGLTPLVYIPGADTMYWENSCASGSSAVGMYLARISHFPTHVALIQPGGTLTVECDPESHTTWLYGRARMVGEYEIVM